MLGRNVGQRLHQPVHDAAACRGPFAGRRRSRRSAQPVRYRRRMPTTATSGVAHGASPVPEDAATPAIRPSVLRSRVARLRRRLRLASPAPCDSGKLFRRCRPLRPARCLAARTPGRTSSRPAVCVLPSAPQMISRSSARVIATYRSRRYSFSVSRSATCARTGDRRRRPRSCSPTKSWRRRASSSRGGPARPAATWYRRG